MSTKAKKIIFTIIIVSLAIALLSPTGVLFRKGKFRLSLMSDERLAAFLEESGVRVPKQLDDPESNRRMIRRTVLMTEKDPKCRIVTEFTPRYVFQMMIRDAVNIYYGITDHFTEGLPEVDY